MKLPWRQDTELESIAGIQRNVPPAVSQRMVVELTRKHLGPTWGRRRRKIEGWPRGRS